MTKPGMGGNKNLKKLSFRRIKPDSFINPFWKHSDKSSRWVRQRKNFKP